MDQSTLQALPREAVRETVTEVLQLLLEADRDAFLRQKGGRKNGHYPRKRETPFGQVELAIPRDREGQYYPSFLTPYARRQVDVGEVAVALYAAGVTQRKAAEGMRLLLGHRTDEVLEKAEAFRGRPLPEEMALVYLDGFFLKVLREGLGVEREAVYVALGVTPEGARRVLGFWLLPTENASAWEGVLRELWERGLRRVLLFITDGLPGIGVYMAESRREALGALERLREVWGGKYPALVAAWWEDSGALLRFYDYPRALWPYLRSTNLMERFIREVRRGAKVRDHRFPRPEAVFKLLYLEGEHLEGRWAERKLKGFAEAREVLERMLQERYAPRTQTLTHNS